MSFRPGFGPSLVAAALLFLTPLPVPAQAPGGAGGLYSGQPVSGDYAVYRDGSWKEPTWIGFLYYDDSTWGAFLKAPTRSTDVRILFRAEPADGKLVLTGQNIISKISNDDVETVNYLMGLLPDLFSWSSSASAEGNRLEGERSPLAGRSALLPPASRTKRTEAQFGGEITLEWAPEVPLFGLSSLSTSTGSRLLTLDRTGRVGSKGDSVFFDFKPLAYDAPESGDTVRSITPAGKGETRVIDGIELHLDGNWTMVADNAFFMGNDAMLVVSRLDTTAHTERDLAAALVRRFSLSGDMDYALSAETSLSGTPDRFLIGNLFYDAESRSFKRDLKLCLPERGPDGSLSGVQVLTLVVDDRLYGKNREYFDGLY